MDPKNLKYTRTHEWAGTDGDAVVVGITAHAGEELGEITYVELPEVGDTVEQDGEFGTVESVKATSDLNSPVSGEVIEVNSKLADNPGLVNESPYDAGWLIRVRPSDPTELEALLDSAAYEETLK